MIRVLYVNGGLMDRGGISAYMMNYYREIDKKRFSIDFVTQGEGDNLYVEEIESKGGKIIKIPNKGKNFLRHITLLSRAIYAGHYDIVHSHADAGNCIVLLIAELLGVRVRISHSHSTDFMTESKSKRFLNYAQKKAIRLFATDFWGCSEDACKWLYGDRVQSLIIHNAIDVRKYAFDEKKRFTYREQLHISDNTIAICQVGHLSYIKNQEFSLKVLKELLNRGKNVCLYIVGDGEDRNKIEEYADNNGIRDAVKILGVRDDIGSILSAMDYVFLPSLFEGFPITLLEAQCSGIRCIASNNVTKEACVVKELVRFYSIQTDKSVNTWADSVDTNMYERRERSEAITKSGYNIYNEAKKLMSNYELMCGE